MNPEKLLYLSRDPRRDLMDRMVDWAFFQSIRRIETGGSERNIPPQGPFVLGFAPHAGWLEVFAIDHFLRKARDSGQGAVWISKKVNGASCFSTARTPLPMFSDPPTELWRWAGLSARP
ncbi:MAG: hypothetical protein UX67_C0028G0027 [Candidatus Woesebacteria bacterium GW2011_GWF2_46_8]|uniref:Uncharacterized protein n=1 Tax=Candidatus Woesebacteria bacterium GW2011_GWF2_46_8 TaxID=1618604 RepID=A0A0G1QSE0_9BACT|nr:MAG: hypothetical protein UX67_C0028G0027 [Candidatus Woesebacteria bacterium GW2011_GWF2_46_8]